NRSPVTSDSIDTEVGVLLVEDERKSWRSVVANFACHPVIVQVQPYVSADFPGFATNVVERNISDSGICLFLQGAAGNIEPPDSISRRRKFDPTDWTPVDSAIDDAFGDAQRLGLRLGEKVIELTNIASEPDYPTVDGPIMATREVVTVNSRDD